MACCIKGCNSRRDQNGSPKKSFFSACTNDMFTSWCNILCTKNIKINKNSRICELHFKPEDIIREDAFLQLDGTVIYVKRTKPKLKKEAIPSIFPLEKIVTPYYREIEHKNDIDIMSCEFLIECDVLETSHTAEEPIPSTSHEMNKAKEEITKFSAEHVNIAKSIEVPKSSTSCWFVNFNDSHMMWTCWAKDLSYILRRVIITPNMKVQVFIGNKEISFDTKMINDIQEINQILMELQNFFPCEEVSDEDRVTNCNGFIINRQYKVNQKMRCLPCTKRWKMLLRKSHNLTPIQKLNKK